MARICSRSISENCIMNGSETAALKTDINFKLELNAIEFEVLASVITGFCGDHESMWADNPEKYQAYESLYNAIRKVSY